MKSSVVLLVCAVLVVSSGSAIAALTRDTVKADIPFDFVVNNKTFASGPYTIERLSDNDTDILAIRSVDSKAVMVFHAKAEGSNPGAPSKLVFLRNGATYSLLTVVGEFATYSVPVTRSRQQMAKRQDTTTVQATP